LKYLDVTWVPVKNDYDECLSWNCVLYALYDDSSRIYYIGKADKQTLLERLKDPAKTVILNSIRRFGSQPTGILCGIVNSFGSYFVPSQLLSDAEALLIKEENPRSNTVHPTIREDLTVRCAGEWRGKKNEYQYNLGLTRMRQRLSQPSTLPGIFGSPFDSYAAKRLGPPKKEKEPTFGDLLLRARLSSPSSLIGDLLTRKK
jgi:hypothetical protein